MADETTPDPDDDAIEVEEPNYTQIPEWVLDAKISDRAVRLYGVLRRYGTKAYPGRVALAERLHCSVDSIDRAARELVTLGAVDKSPRYRSQGGRSSNLWRVFWFRRGRTTAVHEPQPCGHPGRARAAGKKDSKDEPSTSAAPATPSAKTRKRTPRDDIFDALVELFGPASTKSRGAFYGRTVTQLVDAGATVEQMRKARIEMSRRGWDKPTPEAMLKHWDSLIGEGVDQRNPAADRFWEQ